MLEIVVASSNKGKIEEFSDMLQGLNKLKFIPQSDFDILPVDETGHTYVENAILKARQASKISGLPNLANDSGLFFEAVGG